MVNRSLLFSLPIIFILVPLVFVDSVEAHGDKGLGIEIGLESFQFSYKEPNVMKERGVMYGVSGAVSYIGWFPPSPAGLDRCVLRLEGSASLGKVDYEGGLSDGSPYNIENIDDYILEIRGLVGYEFSLSDILSITPYGGYAYRYWNDDLSFDLYGYERESNYFYNPIGILASMDLNNSWAVGARLEYDSFIKGIQLSRLSNLPGFTDIKNVQNKGYGWRGALRFCRKGQSIDFLIAHFIRVWRIKESDISVSSWNGISFSGVEPKNNTREIGINFSAIY